MKFLIVLSIILSQTSAYPGIRSFLTKEETGRPLRRALQTTAQIEAVKDRIEQLIDGNQDLGPKFVRLTFHACVGGCNGCVDMANVSSFRKHTEKR